MADLLSEMLREAERGVDQQLKVLEEMDDKSEQLLALSLGTLGAGLALFVFATDRLPGRVDATFKTLLGLAIVLNLCGLLSFLAGYVGLPGSAERFAGPSPAWLKEKANVAGWRRDEHLVTLIGSYADYFAHNAALGGANRRAHRAGLLMLAVAMLGYAVAGLYVLG
jgi:hypothetical protein